MVAKSGWERRSPRSIRCTRFIRRGDSAPGSQLGAVQSSHGIGEFKRVPHGGSFEHRITERPVKHVSGAGSVDAIHHESGGVNETFHFRGQRAVRA